MNGVDLMRTGDFVRFLISPAIFLLAFTPAMAQQKAGLLLTAASPQGEVAAIPDAPVPSAVNAGEQSAASTPSSSASASTANADEAQQTKRILWIIPNFRAVSAGVKLPPQTVKEKFKTGALDSFDYSSFIFVGIQAGISQGSNAYPAFRQGAAGYGRYYWHTFADETDENLWVEGILPSVLHQDNRYYTLGHGGFFKRGIYAVTRTAVTRTDSGHETFNASEIVGAGAAASISSLYYPSQERTFSKTYQLWFTSIAIDAGSSLFKEFWPDINNK